MSLSDQFSFQKTERMIRKNLPSDIKVFCRSCELCQCIQTKGNVSMVHISKICQIYVLNESWEDKSMAKERQIGAFSI